MWLTAMARRSRKRDSDVSGLLLVDKPKGLSSFDVVAQIRRIYGTRRVGHTGTLDPMATGLLAILLGRGTRLSPYVTDADKAYVAELRFGMTTDSFDMEGKVTSTADESVTNALLREELEAALVGFRGDIEQVPPAYSAIKIDGERAYARARRGESVEMPSRAVSIRELRCAGFETGQARLLVRCSKGTYIRSLAHDIGQVLGVGATLSALRRTEVGTWSVEDAYTIESLSNGDEGLRGQALLPLAEAVSDMPDLRLVPDEVAHVRNGRRFHRPDIAPDRYRALEADGLLVAIVEVSDAGQIRVVRGIPTEPDVSKP